ncbi:minor tail H domain protein, partial [Escherichia coli EC1865]
SACP